MNTQFESDTLMNNDLDFFFRGLSKDISSSSNLLKKSIIGVYNSNLNNNNNLSTNLIQNNSLKLDNLRKTNDYNYSLERFEKILNGYGGRNFWKYGDRFKELNKISNFGFSSYDIDSSKGLERLLDITEKLNFFEKKIEKKYVLNTKVENNIFNKKIKDGFLEKYLDETSELQTLKNNVEIQIENLKSRYYVREDSIISKNLKEILYSNDSNSWIRIKDRIEIIYDFIEDLKISKNLDYETITSLSRFSEEIEISRNKKFKNHFEELGILKNSLDDFIFKKSKEFGVSFSQLRSKVINIGSYNEENFLQKKVNENLNKISNDYTTLYGFFSRHLKYGTDRKKYYDDKVYRFQLNSIYNSIQSEKKELISVVNSNSKILNKIAGITYLKYLDNSFFNSNLDDDNCNKCSLNELEKKIKKINSKPNYLFEFKNQLYNKSKINWLSNDLINLYGDLSSNSFFIRNKISEDLIFPIKMHNIFTLSLKETSSNFRKKAVEIFGNEFRKVVFKILDSSISKNYLNESFLNFRKSFFNEIN